MNNHKPISLTKTLRLSFLHTLWPGGMEYLRKSQIFKISAAIILIINSNEIQAQFGATKPGLKFEVSYTVDIPKKGDTIELIFKSLVPNPYHLYSEKSDCPEDDGPIRAEWNFPELAGIELLGKPYGVGDHMAMDDVFKCSTGEFEARCEFRQKIVITGTVHDFTVDFNGQICSVIDGTCHQINETVTVPLHVH